MDYPNSVANVSLLDGKFTDGNPTEGVPASLDPSQWSNQVTDELLNIITSAGITPSETVSNQLATSLQAGALNYGADTGAANAYVVAYDPVVTTLTVGQKFRFLALHANTEQCTLDVGTGPLPLVGLGGLALGGGEIPALSLASVQYVGAAGFVLLYANGGAQQLPSGSYGSAPAVNDNSKKIPTTGWLWTNIQALVSNCISAVATAAGFSCSLGTNGYVKFPSWLGAFIIQWGSWTTSATPGGAVGISFPLTFPNALYRGFVTAGSTGTSQTVWLGSGSLTGMNAYGSAASTLCSYFVIGD